MKKKISVSVGIPIMPQRLGYIKKCLDSVLNQNYTGEIEIILSMHPGFKFETDKYYKPDNINFLKISSGSSLSEKRNDIIKSSTGDYILFIDDDVIVDTYWLTNMMKDVLKFNYDFFWGTAKPIYEAPFPEELDALEMYIGGFHFNRFGELKKRGLIGCNFGIKKNIKHLTGKFHSSLGRGSGYLDAGEETLFLEQCIDAKYGFIPSSIVKHHIQKDRINFSYILDNRLLTVKGDLYFAKFFRKKNPFSIFFDLVKDFIKELIKFNNFKMLYFKYKAASYAFVIAFSLLFMKNQFQTSSNE